MHLSTVKIPINFRHDGFWSSLSFTILKPIFLSNLFAPFLYISSETRRLLILVIPSLASDRISLGFWLNISFVINHRGAFRSIIAFAIDLLTSEGRYFLWITAVPLPRRCLQSQQHSGSLMRRVTLVLCGPPNLRPKLDHCYLIFYSSVNPLRPENCIYLQSDLSSL